MKNVMQAVQQEPQTDEAAIIDKLVKSMNGQFVDAHGIAWNVRAVHHDDSHYLRYEAVINGNEVWFSGLHRNTTYYAFAGWSAGSSLLRDLGANQLSNLYLTSVEDAVEWCHSATELAEQAVNRHVNNGRFEAAIRKLEQDKDNAIEEINKKHDKAVASLTQKASLAPSDDIEF